MMPGIDLVMLAAANDAVLTGANAVVQGVCIDSRKLANGDVFVALRGEQSDGHQYVASAAKSGAIGAVVESLQDADIPQILVADTERALGIIAKLNRDAFKGKVVAITGSAGKTSCKNMLAAILAQVGSVCATAGNFNNEFGLPLTVQRLNVSHDFAVLEMGAAKMGDIAYLAAIGQPHISAITNVGEAHIGGFGSLQNTATTKGEIYQVLDVDGFAVINGDDSFADFWRDSLKQKLDHSHLIECSMDNGNANVYASDIQQTSSGIKFTAHCKLAGDTSGQALDIKVGFLGIHNVNNALMAIAIAKALSVSDQHIIAGLQAAEAESGRLCPLAGRNQLQLLDDSYNASPKAVCAAVDVLVALSCRQSSRRSANQSVLTIAVLADMGELGEEAGQQHKNIGQYAAKAGVTRLYAIGDFASHTVNAFLAEAQQGNNQQAGTIEASVSETSASIFASQDEIIEQLLSPSCAGANVLIKGSRFTKMENIVKALDVKERK